MISYAQNGEDVVLARLFRASNGFYVDIGAGHPVVDSVTKHFYDRGWCGINVEPLPEEHLLLTQHRPRDINVRAAVAASNGPVTLYPGPPSNRGATTLVAEFAPPADERGPPPEPIQVDSIRLLDLLEEHGMRAIDFLKIDVEGYEAVVIGDVDWKTVRPRVVVIESTLPNTTTPSHGEWEPVMLAAGYECALFDGLNRFYARNDDAEALETLSAPINVFDDAQPWHWVRRVEQAEARAADADARTSALTAARDEAVEYAATVEAARDEAVEHAATVEAARDEAVEHAATVEAARDEAVKYAATVEAARDEAVEYAATLEAARAEADRWSEAVCREVADLSATARVLLLRALPNAADLSPP